MYSLLLLNGGIGSRIGANQPKQLLKVQGIPLLVYSLIAVDRVDAIDQIILNYPRGWKKAISDVLRAYPVKTPVILVEAGKTRHASVAAMLPHAKNNHVIIHESARPLVSKDDFEKLITTPQENVAYMLDIPFTVAPVDPKTHAVTGSLERDKLRNVQLPQKFNKQHLLEAHQKSKTKGQQFTEDATLVASNDFPVFFINGNDYNIKVTTPLDITIATHLLQREHNNE